MNQIIEIGIPAIMVYYQKEGLYEDEYGQARSTRINYKEDIKHCSSFNNFNNFNNSGYGS